MKYHFLWFLLPLLFFHISAPTEEVDTSTTFPEKNLRADEQFPPPWFTGPLLTPAGSIVPIGYINFEPYTFVNVFTGDYDKDWNSFSTPTFYDVNFQASLYIGLSNWIDMQIIPQASWNETENVTSLEFNDLFLSLEFQVLKNTETNQIPDLKIYIQETFPTGHYQRRQKEKKGTDIGGQGSFITTLGFVVARTFHIYRQHYLAFRFNGFYDIPTSSHVHGINFYGGAENTNATVNVGQSFGILSSLEYSLTKNWALAIDFSAEYRFQSTFSGNPGTNADGTLAPLGLPSFILFSLAPAIEYNFNEYVGIIAGGWFTIAGKNAPRFASGVIAINYFGPEKKSKQQRSHPSGGGRR